MIRLLIQSSKSLILLGKKVKRKIRKKPKMVMADDLVPLEEASGGRGSRGDLGRRGLVRGVEDGELPMDTGKIRAVLLKLLALVAGRGSHFFV